MKHASIKLKTSIQNIDIMNNNIEVERVILNTMLSFLGILALLYVFILGNTVVNIMERRAMEREVLTMSNEVGNLELSYLSIFNSVDLALSSSMGYKETRINFAVRKSLGSLKIDKNEI